ncbi:restriction endonuclease subunit S [Salimicrobium salexigens]|uniref:Type I restriction enzyme, S subunit n=1 Tax=Salimicrobium salexigens TaxID=908941 RepID=A0ABY1KQW9_9BACI|nr:restriction endonuclease subunit S [Salimicrobium salexigens]SIS66594.1 type I restriction enzyme, S subunit [Salimicrobium salexigens]
MSSVTEKFEDSGVHWIGSVPDHWSVSKIGYFYEVQLGKMVQPNKKSETDKLVPYLKAVNVQDSGLKYNDENKMYASSTDLAKYDVEKGDLLVCEGGEIGRSALVDKEYKGFVFQNSLHRVRSTFNNVQFLHYIMQAIRNSGYIDVLVNRLTIAHLTRERLIGVKIAIPNKGEQDVIVQFLNHKTSEIDTLIADKQKLIELLEEKRQAVISEAVTKGLDPDVPMKDSGVAWIGEIPEHWGLNRLGTITDKLSNGYVGPTRDVLRDHGIRYLQSLHIKQGKVLFDKKPYYVDESWGSKHEKSKLKKGDLVIVQTGDIGQCAVITREFEDTNCHALIIVRLKEHVGFGEYLNWYFQSNYGFFSLLSFKTGALHPHLDPGRIKNMKILLPPKEEQENIINYLNREITDIESIINIQKKIINRFKEYRQSLIYEAVTGKIDVQEMERKIEQEEVSSS